MVVFLSLWCLWWEVLDNCIDFWSLPSFLFCISGLFCLCRVVAVKGLPVHSFNALIFPILRNCTYNCVLPFLKLASFRYLLKVIIKPMFAPRCITIVCLWTYCRHAVLWAFVIPSFYLNDLPSAFPYAVLVNDRYEYRFSFDGIATLQPHEYY